MTKFHSKPLNRNSAKNDPIRVYYLFLEGSNTEPQYFQALLAHLGKGSFRLEQFSASGEPKSIAEKAVARAKELGLAKSSRRKLSSFEEADEVWAVFDKDTHEHYGAPKQYCCDNGIGVAYSDPCFEHWINLHTEVCDAPYSHHDAQKKCEKLHPGYDRKSGKTLDFKTILSNLPQAEQRAERQLNARIQEGNPEGTPSTTVHKLTASMQTAAEASRRRKT